LEAGTGVNGLTDAMPITLEIAILNFAALMALGLIEMYRGHRTAAHALLGLVTSAALIWSSIAWLDPAARLGFLLGLVQAAP
jgi:hypothetical protein